MLPWDPSPKIPVGHPINVLWDGGDLLHPPDPKKAMGEVGEGGGEAVSRAPSTQRRWRARGQRGPTGWGLGVCICRAKKQWGEVSGMEKDPRA